MTRRAITPQGLRALAEARRAAVLRAHDAGASYGVIAGELGISRDQVQQIVAAAREDKGRR